MTMIEEWLLNFIVVSFTVMGLAVWSLNAITSFSEKFMEDFKNDDQNGENE